MNDDNLAALRFDGDEWRRVTASQQDGHTYPPWKVG